MLIMLYIDCGNTIFPSNMEYYIMITKLSYIVKIKLFAHISPFSHSELAHFVHFIVISTVNQQHGAPTPIY